MVEYHDVKRSPEKLAEMLAWTKGEREVPVIVEDGRTTVGFGGT